MSDILERLEAYTPPDRTISEQRRIAVDIQDAAAEITRLQELHLERTKLTTQVIEERDRLKEELAGCNELLETFKKWGDEV